VAAAATRAALKEQQQETRVAEKSISLENLFNFVAFL
jgi:hypothetical protein